MIQHLTKDNIEKLLKTENKLIILDFWAEWCGPCRMISTIIDEISETLNENIIIGKINVDEEPELAVRYGIRSIPTLIFIKNNQIIDKQVGATSKNNLLEKIKKLM